MAAEVIAQRFALEIGFRAIGVPRTREILGRWADSHLTPQSQPPAKLASSVAAMHRIVNRSGAGGGTCLVRSLALWASLRRRGVDAVLRVGIRKRGNAIEGHAWLEFDGTPLNETRKVASTYVLFSPASDFALPRLR